MKLELRCVLYYVSKPGPSQAFPLTSALVLNLEDCADPSYLARLPKEDIRQCAVRPI